MIVPITYFILLNTTHLNHQQQSAQVISFNFQHPATAQQAHTSQQICEQLKQRNQQQQLVTHKFRRLALLPFRCSHHQY